MKLSIITAMSMNGVIGKDGKLPWHFPSDLKFFKDTTLGKSVIMGRKTFESLDKPLPNRKNIVVTRNINYALHQQDVEITLSLGQALKLCREEREVFVIGGAELYKKALPFANKLYVTIVNEEYEGDTYFPPFDWTKYIVVNQESLVDNNTRLTLKVEDEL